MCSIVPVLLRLIIIYKTSSFLRYTFNMDWSDIVVAVVNGGGKPSEGAILAIG